MKTGVFIGRFQPYHVGHEHVVTQALQHLDRLIIVIGSADAARSPRNPWTAAERIEMISRSHPWHIANDRIIFRTVRDHPSDDRWIADVRSNVLLATDPGDEITLVGFGKDASSYYLKQFPDWKALDVSPVHRVLNSTDIRKAYFQPIHRVETTVLNAVVSQFLSEWIMTDAYWRVFYEHEAVERYKSMWRKAPFPPTFITVDAVVVQSGHILLIERGDYPGKGLMALPGGFIDQYERIRDAAVRELREETEIADRRGRIPAGRLGGYIEAEKVFDNPYRSSRGRTVTHAFLFRLPDAKPMWDVKGADDAASASWHPISVLRPDRLFEDHYFIIQDMLGL